MKYAIYYNYKTIGDVLVIIFDSNAHPDKVKKVMMLLVYIKKTNLLALIFWILAKLWNLKSMVLFLLSIEKC